MTKIITTFGVLLFAIAILTSCGAASIESDAKKVAELQCKAQKLMQEAASGDMALLEKSSKLATEAATLSNEMQGKYNSDADKQKFAEALLKEISKCK